MPFAQLECTPDTLLKLKLPAQRDPTHRYHYSISEHSDGRALHISQWHQHNSETFETEVLVYGGRKYLVESDTSCEYYEDCWHYTLTAIRVLADSLGPSSELAKYLPDLLVWYSVRNAYTKIPEQVTLQVLPLASAKRAIVRRFPN